VWVVIAVAGPIAAAAALTPLRPEVRPVNVALVLTAIVVAIAVGGGRLPGAIAAITSAIAFDFFHTQPYLRFTIDSRDDVETTVLLLLVGLVVGHVAARERRARSREDMRAGEIGRLYRIAALGARGASQPALLDAACAELCELLALRSCRFEHPPFEEFYDRLERSGVVAWQEQRLHRNGFELPAHGCEIPVSGRGRLLGRFVLEPRPGVGVSLEQRVVAVALADQVGATLAVPAAS
jgi:hypothetical protein